MAYEPTIILSGLGFPHRLILSGYTAPDPRYCPDLLIDNGLLMQGLLSPTENNLITHGFNPLIADLYNRTTISFDTTITTEHTLDTPIDSRDLITELHNIWI
jgi:hypothetical protein